MLFKMILKIYLTFVPHSLQNTSSSCISFLQFGQKNLCGSSDSFGTVLDSLVSNELSVIASVKVSSEAWAVSVFIVSDFSGIISGEAAGASDGKETVFSAAGSSVAADIFSNFVPQTLQKIASASSTLPQFEHFFD